MRVGINFANCDGPKPGSTRAISQRKAISEGYEAAKSERRVDTRMAGGGEKSGGTGGMSAPGLTSKPKPNRM